MIFYYSGCGNSRWIAEQLSVRLDEELAFIPNLLQGDSKEYAINEGVMPGKLFFLAFLIRQIQIMGGLPQ